MEQLLDSVPFRIEFPMNGTLTDTVATQLNAIGADVERDIVKHVYLECYANRQNANNTAWTAAIIKALASLGSNRGYLPFPNRRLGEEFHKNYRWTVGGEWLFDMVWVDAKDASSPTGYDWRKTRSLVLACESEWSQYEYEILDDFLKLTFSCANLRLFVYTNEKVKTENGELIHPVDLCRAACPTGRGVRYLLVGFPTSNEPANVRVDAWDA